MSKNHMRAATAALTAAALSAVLPSALQAQPAPPLQACFVHVSPVGQAGWTYQHDQGRQAMEQALGANIAHIPFSAEDALTCLTPNVKEVR